MRQPLVALRSSVFTAVPETSRVSTEIIPPKNRFFSLVHPLKDIRRKLASQPPKMTL